MTLSSPLQIFFGESYIVFEVRGKLSIKMFVYIQQYSFAHIMTLQNCGDVAHSPC